jgi:hypothetical protein
MPQNLTSPRLMFLKALFFLLIALFASTILLLDSPTLLAALKTAALLALLAWSAARFYYFFFYVITHYIDPAYTYAGLFHALHHYFAIRRSRPIAPVRHPENGAK